MSTSSRIKELLEKTKNYDADERFMAMHDLIEQLKQTTGQLDAALQVPVRDTLLRLLNDGSSDVATVTVKCLQQLVNKLSAEQIAYIAERMGALISQPAAPSSATNSSSDDDSNRVIGLDIVADSLQTIITAASPDNGKQLAPKLLTNLLTALKSSDSAQLDRTMACLQLLRQIIQRYGAQIAESQQPITSCLLSLLSHPVEAVRKRASVTFGPVVYIVDDALFGSLMATLIERMDDETSAEIYIQSVSAISKAAGVRVGQYLPLIVPKLTKFLTMTREEREGEEPEERRIELLETCLQAIEAVILRCPTKVTPYVAQLVNTAIEWSTYDPLYTYDDDGSSAMAEDDWANGGSAKKLTARERQEQASSAMTDDTETEEAEEDGGWNGEVREDDAADDDWGDDGAADGAAADAGGGWGAEDEEAGGISAGSNDTSWKVRRAAVGVLSAFIKARSDLLKEWYTRLFDHIVSRMKERDSAVKEELLFACRDLLHESVVSERATSATATAAASDLLPGSVPSLGGPMPSSTSLDFDEPMFAVPLFHRTRSTYATLDTKTPALVVSVERQFAAADIRTQQAIFAVLTELFQVRHGQLARFLPRIIPHCIAGIAAQGKQAAVNADALTFVRLLLESHTDAEVQPYLKDLTEATIKSVRNGLPKNIPAGLAVLTAVSAHLPSAGKALVSTLARDVFRVVYAQLEQNDVPLDVKLSSLSTIAALCSHVGAPLERDVPRLWPVLAERMNNDTTCQPTLRAVTRMACSAQVDCTPMIAHTDEMVAFLRKSSHHLRHVTVRALEALMTAHPRSFQPAQVQLVVRQVTPYIDDADLQLAHLVLDLLSTTLHTAQPGSRAAMQAAMSGDVTARAISLACSPVLQGQSLQSLTAFFRQLVKAQSPTTPPSSRTRSSASSASPPASSAASYPSLLSALTAHISPQLHRQAYSALGKCIAAITAEATADERDRTIAQQLANVKLDQSKQRNSPLTQLSLLVLGEIGRTRDLSGVAGLETALLASFHSDAEGVRSAAAFALGSVTLGNMPLLLPRLLRAVESERKTSLYLLLSALKEVIGQFTGSRETLAQFAPYLQTVMPLLFAQTDSSDESTRAMVSECLGRLTVVSPATLLPHLEQLVASPKPAARAVCITALRFSFTPLMDYELLRGQLPRFLSLINDADLEVKRQTVLTVNALFREHVDIIDGAALSSTLLPALFAHTKPNPALVREIDYGAFKQTVDDGKPLRKAAYQTLSTLLDVAPHRVDLHALTVALQTGLHDESDIQLSSYSTYLQLAQQQPQVVLESLDALPKLCMAPIKAHLQAAKGEREQKETALDCLRACMRCFLVFNAMDGVEHCTQYTHFYKQVCATPLLVQLLKEIQLPAAA